MLDSQTDVPISSAVAIRPFGVCRPTSLPDPDSGALPVGVPTLDNDAAVLVNSPIGVVADGFGSGSYGPMVDVAYDPATGTPAVGTVLGSKAGSTLLSVGNRGFVATQAGVDGVVRCVRYHAITTVILQKFGAADGDGYYQAVRKVYDPNSGTWSEAGGYDYLIKDRGGLPLYNGIQYTAEIAGVRVSDGKIVATVWRERLADATTEGMVSAVDQSWKGSKDTVGQFNAHGPTPTAVLTAIGTVIGSMQPPHRAYDHTSGYRYGAIRLATGSSDPSGAVSSAYLYCDNVYRSAGGFAGVLPDIVAEVNLGDGLTVWAYLARFVFAGKCYTIRAATNDGSPPTDYDGIDHLPGGTGPQFRGGILTILGTGFGTVTGVDGGTTGLTFSGGAVPVLSGTLVEANGGTGQTTFVAALVAAGGTSGSITLDP